MARNANIQKSKVLARLLFPAVEQLATVYDAQTAFNAASGIIKQKLDEKLEEYTVGSLELDIEKVPEGPIKHAIKSMLELVENEKAGDAMQLIGLMGQKLPEFIVSQHIKDPMSSISAKEYISE